MKKKRKRNDERKHVRSARDWSMWIISSADAIFDVPWWHREDQDRTFKEVCCVTDQFSNTVRAFSFAIKLSVPLRKKVFKARRLSVSIMHAQK